jgi:GNAT superfamily N-acetyltransferase
MNYYGSLEYNTKVFLNELLEVCLNWELEGIDDGNREELREHSFIKKAVNRAWKLCVKSNWDWDIFVELVKEDVPKSRNSDLEWLLDTINKYSNDKDWPIYKRFNLISQIIYSEIYFRIFKFYSNEPVKFVQENNAHTDNPLSSSIVSIWEKTNWKGVKIAVLPGKGWVALSPFDRNPKEFRLDIYVLPEFRKRGLSNLLLKALKYLKKNEDLTHFWVSVGRTERMNFYKHIFKDFKTKYDDGFLKIQL